MRTVLDFVKGHGLGGCLFPTPFDVSPTLDLREIGETRAYAESRELYMDASSGQISPFHFVDRKRVSAAGGGDFRTGLERLPAALAYLPTLLGRKQPAGVSA